MASGDGTQMMVFGSNQGHDDRALVNGISTLITETPEGSPDLLPCDNVVKRAICESGNELSPDPESAYASI